MDILFFALIAFFIGYKYFTTIGKHSEESDDLHQKREEIKQRIRKEFGIFSDENFTTDENDSNIIKDATPVQTRFSEDETVNKIFLQINKKFPNFNEKFFLEGANEVFTLLIKEFSKRNLEELKKWVNQDVYNHFKELIDRQEQEKKYIQSTVAKVDSSIASGEIINNMAKINIKFVSEQIILQYDENNKIIAGDPRSSEQITDYWLFEKNLNENNLKWTLVKINSQ